MIRHGPCRDHHDPKITRSTARKYTDAAIMKITLRDRALAINFSREVNHFCLSVIQSQHICPHPIADLDYTFLDRTSRNLIAISCIIQLDVVSINYILQTMMKIDVLLYMQNNSGPKTEP